MLPQQKKPYLSSMEWIISRTMPNLVWHSRVNLSSFFCGGKMRITGPAVTTKVPCKPLNPQLASGYWPHVQHPTPSWPQLQLSSLHHPTNMLFWDGTHDVSIGELFLLISPFANPSALMGSTDWFARTYHDLHGAPARCAPVHGHSLVDYMGHCPHRLCQSKEKTFQNSRT